MPPSPYRGLSLKDYEEEYNDWKQRNEDRERFKEWKRQQESD